MADITKYNSMLHKIGPIRNLNYFLAELGREIVDSYRSEGDLLMTVYVENFKNRAVTGLQLYGRYVEQFYSKRPLMAGLIRKLGLTTHGVYAFVPIKQKQLSLASRLCESFERFDFDDKNTRVLEDLVRELLEEGKDNEVSRRNLSSESLDHIAEIAKIELATWIEGRTSFVPSFRDTLGIQWFPRRILGIFLDGGIKNEGDNTFELSVTMETYADPEVIASVGEDNIKSIYELLMNFSGAQCVIAHPDNFGILHLVGEGFQHTA
ncbi:MAG: hypothetical protein NZO16_07090 [Deltaproteobacteria bacterium]|nr:hypothetical protein [Deltaproteobacteria bacterium]